MADVIREFVAQNQVINLSERHVPLKACSVEGLFRRWLVPRNWDVACLQGFKSISSYQSMNRDKESYGVCY